MADIADDLRHDLQPIAEQYASIRLGLFLHGSHSRGAAGPRSDVDVIGLYATDRDEDRVATEQASFEALAARPWPGPLDLKIIPAGEFAADPWVDLRTACWLAGEPWHQTLPPRTHDQAARESIAVFGSLFEYGDFADRDDAHDLAKRVGRLCSVLASLVTDVVPQSAEEALRVLRPDTRLAAELRDLRADLAALPKDTQVPEDLSHRVQRAADDVAAVLRVHVERGLLGPICTAAAARALTAHRPLQF
ncbi:nucleotidyltransferase domain-containing protein [Microlunatus parietis]|uniref:Putative nucleotidyltransferase n=1 Tax=Microlunatus parietis TaxID=682979 RepID=A0A7Y9LA97_9ACTN|nr:nucleotidyltransferase domain-containing protein [Microlunatus parietis]NYE70427.1 putative nucleotidyltransferase [Microlunatus parietis]